MNRRILLGLALAAALCGTVLAQEKSIVVASTTSTQDSGLFGHILPIFKAKTGIGVKVIAQGTGQALDTAKRGDADVVFVHAKAQEERFVSDGFGVKRFAVMYNDFVLIGPKSDPAGVKGKDIETALKAIRAKAAPFVSRGDRSGTHSAELALWKAADVDPVAGDIDADVEAITGQPGGLRPGRLCSQRQQAKEGAAQAAVPRNAIPPLAL